MYARHFNLTHDPFSIAPDPRFLFMSDRHREALAHLLFGVQGTGGVVLLTGEIGTGKTTVCRSLLEQIPSNCNLAIVFNPKLTVIELLQTICEEFHIWVPESVANPAGVKTYVKALNEFLLKSHAEGRSSVLIVDEAQNLSVDVLEQLRLLTNLETNERKLLQIVLIGQPELRGLLQRPDLEQLAQRVVARFHLEALDERETLAYVSHRLGIAGLVGPSPFDVHALRRIYRYTRGVPRRINLLCGRALLGAWSHGVDYINRPIVDQAAAEVFGSGPPPWRPWRKVAVAAALGLTAAFALAVSVTVTERMDFWSPRPAQVPDASPSEPVRTEELATLAPQLPRDIARAWEQLAAHLQLGAEAGALCARNPARHQCYRGLGLSTLQLRQLQRPGILGLKSPSGVPMYVVLLSLDGEMARLRVDGQLRQVPLSSLAAMWHGDFSTFWTPPVGYMPRLSDGASSAFVNYLEARLDALEGRLPHSDPARNHAVFDQAMRERVRSFQQWQGLRPDGEPGPLTLMQMDRILSAGLPDRLNRP